jgi:hypothetical protein
LGRVVCRAELGSALESKLCVAWGDVNLFLWVSTVSAESLRCHFGKEGSRMFGFDEALPGVFVSQPSPFMPRNLSTPLLLFSNLSSWFRNEKFHFLYCGAQKAFFGHFGHIQRQAHVGLFQLYLTSLPCHSCRPVENLQNIS